MRFEWDGAKSERNRRERGLPFDLAAQMFEDCVIEVRDNRRDYGEIRMKALGVVAGEILARVYTDRGDVRRVISLRYANRRERDGYREAASR